VFREAKFIFGVGVIGWFGICLVGVGYAWLARDMIGSAGI